MIKMELQNYKLKHQIYKLCNKSGTPVSRDSELIVMVDGIESNLKVEDLFLSGCIKHSDSIEGYSILQECSIEFHSFKIGKKLINFKDSKTDETVGVKRLINPVVMWNDRTVTQEDMDSFTNLLKIKKILIEDQDTKSESEELESENAEQKETTEESKDLNPEESPQVTPVKNPDSYNEERKFFLDKGYSEYSNGYYRLLCRDSKVVSVDGEEDYLITIKDSDFSSSIVKKQDDGSYICEERNLVLNINGGKLDIYERSKEE